MNLENTVFKTLGESGRPICLNHNSIKKAINILKTLHNKLRLQILKLLDDNEKLTVTEIFIKLRIDQSAASVQLSILRKAGVVISVKKGRQVYYSIHAEQIEYFNAIVLKIVDNHGCFYNSSVYISPAIQ